MRGQRFGPQIGGKKPRKSALQGPSVVRPAKKPPPGYYNPDLDATERAAGRGLGDLTIDTETANQRASTGYITTRDRTEQDYGRATGLLAQRFRDIGQAQASAGVAQGVFDPTTALASRMRRDANQAVEQQGLDTARSRTLEDAGRDYRYGVDDRALGLTRAQRENTILGLDTAEQRAFQARAAGYVEPKAGGGKKKPGGLSAAQRRQVGRRTTASSKQRLREKLRAQNRKKGR